MSNIDFNINPEIYAIKNKNDKNVISSGSLEQTKKIVELIDIVNMFAKEIQNGENKNKNNAKLFQKIETLYNKQVFLFILATLLIIWLYKKC